MSDQWTVKKEDKGPHGTGYTETHPSYGVIGINQVSGGGYLFGSEVNHHHCIQLTISEARRVVDTPREFVMPERELIRISLTNAQFAEMITNPNRGSGTPCTLERVIGDNGQPWLTAAGGRPDAPKPEHYTKKYKDVMGDRAETISAFISEAKKKIDALMDGTDKPTKANLKELQQDLYMAQMNFDQNMPYVMEEMTEGIEAKMATAKSEFESYVALSLQVKGLSNLASQAPRMTGETQKAIGTGE